MNLYEPHQIGLFDEKGIRIFSMAAGKDFSIFLSERREIFTCGINDQGQLGLGDTLEHRELRLVKGVDDVVQVSAHEGAMALDGKGKIHLWGPVTGDKTLLVPTKLAHINKRVVAASMVV